MLSMYLSLRKVMIPAVMLSLASLLVGCADAEGPRPRDANIPPPRGADTRTKAVNERPDPVMYLPLGRDVLVPRAEDGTLLPATVVGPFELRGETLAGALQLILDGTNVPVAFEATAGLENTITVTNLKGPLDVVVSEVCSLANLYCSYRNGMVVVKDTEIFTVTIPPIVASDSMAQLLTNIAAAIGNITGQTPITDASTRTIVYRASQRTSELASRYFQRLRSNTALIVFETYIWEVSLDAGSAAGIRWSALDQFKKFNVGINLPGGAGATIGTPISIGLPTTGNTNFETGDVLQFIADYGAVKTISQPQITVLSGTEAELRVSDRQNFVASISRTTTDGGNTTVSTTTDHVDSGFTLTIGSNWDNSTVYGNVNILLQEVRQIDTFDDNPDAVVQLPQTTERELRTQVRVRPGDSILIAGLVKENDNIDRSGPGINEPIIPTSRVAQSLNSELVFLLRPRVVVFTSADGPGLRAAPPAVAEIMSKPNPLIPLPSELPAAQPKKEVRLDPPARPDAPVTTPPDSVDLSSVVEDVPAPAIEAEELEAQPMVKETPLAEKSARSSSSVEVSPLFDAAPKAQLPSSSPIKAKEKRASGDPSVIVNYDVLGQ
jgi:MSHA biogenesis protein MshL